MNKEQMEEEKRIRKVQQLNDAVCLLLRKKTDLSIFDVLLAIQYTRKFTLELCPGKNELYNMIYRSRLIRVIEDFYLFNRLSN